jgi:hypothetical protein
MEDNWPEFIYHGKTIKEYVHLVREEERDVKEEIVALLRIVHDLAKHPHENPDENLRVVNAICEAIAFLLELL